MRELCVSTRPDQLQRWQQAFPDGQIISTVQQLDDGVDITTLWLHVDGLSKPQREKELAHLNQQWPQLKVIVITCLPNSSDAMAVFQQGAMGYCHALATPQLLQQVALVVGNGGLWLGAEFKQRLAGVLGRMPAPVQQQTQPSLLDQLSAREQDVARQVASGASNKEIAQILEITERTVKAHMGSIFEKLGIRDRLQLALLISPEQF
ncbi:MAG: response regulator transcription factor [Desulfuromonas sp.]|nr:response regulator transcription factor [Desulfuromonas sp.]